MSTCNASVKSSKNSLAHSSSLRRYRVPTRNVLVMLSPFLLVMLTACCGPTVQPAPRPLLPDSTWLQVYPLDEVIGQPRSYGDVLGQALPSCLATVAQCNADKRALQQWRDRVLEAAP